MISTPLSIIPRPVSFRRGEGVFQSRGLPVLKGDEFFHHEMQVAAEQFQRDAGQTGGAEKAVFCKKETVCGGEKNADEAYRICIAKDIVTIGAETTAGMYHGLQTLHQLILSEYKGGLLTLPCAEIADYPRFQWRGFMLDCSRYFYSVPFIKKIIDIISMHHVNRFHWHLTDDQGWRLPVAEYPLLAENGSLRQDCRLPDQAPAGGFYSEEQIREVVGYAAGRHVEIIPEVDLPGHASAILASYPDLGCTGGPYRVEDRFGIFEDILCAGNDKIFDLAEKIFDTLARLFPSPYVHIGGDEVPPARWAACPQCQKRLAELGLKKPRELQSWITQLLVQMLSRRGKTAIGWDEVLEDSPRFKLPQETVVMSWRGYEGGTQASALGHRVIMSPCTCGCYLDYKHTDDAEEPGRDWGTSSVFDGYSLNPLRHKMTKETATLILGGQCNLWSELIYAGKIAEYMIFPRLCAIAEALWTPFEDKDFDDFSRRLAVHQKRLDRLGLLQYKGLLK